MTHKHSGSVVIVGRPNVGKSTLINALAKYKVSIVSQHQQTTRTVNKSFIDDDEDRQVAYLDTPGWQKKHTGQFNRSLNALAEAAIEEADVIVFMIVAAQWTKADDLFLSRIPKDKPIIAIMNKIDQIDKKETLLPKIADLSKRADFIAIIPISAEKKMGLNALQKEIKLHLNQDITAQSTIQPTVQDEEEQSFYIAELIREKLFRHLGDELPYSVGVVTESLQESKKLLESSLIIYVTKESHKAIVIGKGGSMLKIIGTSARLELEKMANKKVFLSVKVKVEDWKNKPDLLNKMRIGRIL